MKVYDKNRRPIQEGDILKVFHFIGMRKKKYFMYKQAGEIEFIGKDKTPHLFISHLEKNGIGYKIKADGSVLPDYEIVQGYPDFEERQKLK